MLLISYLSILQVAGTLKLLKSNLFDEETKAQRDERYDQGHTGIDTTNVLVL